MIICLINKKRCKAGWNRFSCDKVQVLDWLSADTLSLTCCKARPFMSCILKNNVDVSPSTLFSLEFDCSQVSKQCFSCFSCVFMPGADAGSADRTGCVGDSRFSTPSLTTVDAYFTFPNDTPTPTHYDLVTLRPSGGVSQEWLMEGIVVSHLKGCVTVTLVSTLSWYKRKMPQKKKASDLYLFMCIETEKDEMMSSKTVVI